MKYRLFTLLLFLALPALAAAPQTRVSTCDLQMRIRDGRDQEGLPIPGRRVVFILPCVTKEELAIIIKEVGKGDSDKKDRALEVLNRAKQINLLLTSEVAMQGTE